MEYHLAGLDNAVVALGVRELESQQRDRALSHHPDPFWMVAQTAKSKRKYYTPIRAMQTEDVWDTIFFTKYPIALQRQKLWDLYLTRVATAQSYERPTQAPALAGGSAVGHVQL